MNKTQYGASVSQAIQPCSACGFDRDWAAMHSGPHITRECEWNREWVHAHPLRYYLYNIEGGEHDGKWCVIDRYYDLMDGKPYTRKANCVKSFIKRHSSSNQ